MRSATRRSITGSFAGAVLVAMAMSGCGGDGDGGDEITTTATCRDYLAAPIDARHKAADGAAYDASVGEPPTGSDTWRMYVDEACARNPVAQIDEIVVAVRVERKQASETAEP